MDEVSRPSDRDVAPDCASDLLSTPADYDDRNRRFATIARHSVRSSIASTTFRGRIDSIESAACVIRAHRQATSSTSQ